MEAVITKLAGYRGKAIRAHPQDEKVMTDAVFATFYHAISTEDNPQHDRCPDGETSVRRRLVPFQVLITTINNVGTAHATVTRERGM